MPLSDSQNNNPNEISKVKNNFMTSLEDQNINGMNLLLNIYLKILHFNNCITK